MFEWNRALKVPFGGNIHLTVIGTGTLGTERLVTSEDTASDIRINYTVHYINFKLLI